MNGIRDDSGRNDLDPYRARYAQDTDARTLTVNVYAIGSVDGKVGVIGVPASSETIGYSA